MSSFQETCLRITRTVFEKFKGLPTPVKILLGAAAAYWTREAYLCARRKDITDQVVVITGAGSGMGRLMSIRLSKEGCRLALWDIDEKAANKTCDEIRQMNHRNSADCRAYQVDVTNRELVYQRAKEVLADFGRVDILINNAGIVSGKKLLENNDALMEKTIAVNLTSHLWTIKAFLPGMLERKCGHVVTIASAAGTIGVAGLVDYCGSKYGAIGVNDSLRAELYKLGANVDTLCVCPYYIKSDMFAGVTTKDPLLLPLLDPNYVVSRIVGAIKKRQHYLLMPRFVTLSAALGRILPSGLNDFLAHRMGVNDGMDSFVGHAGKK